MQDFATSHRMPENVVYPPIHGRRNTDNSDLSLDGMGNGYPIFRQLLFHGNMIGISLEYFKHI